MEVSRVCPSQPVAQSSFIIHRAKQTINSAAMYEGWRDATSCEWWGAKNQRPHSFLALMAITSPDSTSKMRLIIRTDPFKGDWLDLMPRQITHKYLLHIKQLHVLCYCTLISDGCHRIIVSSVVCLTPNAMLAPGLNYPNRKKLIMQWNEQDLMLESRFFRFLQGTIGWEKDKPIFNIVSYNHGGPGEFESYFQCWSMADSAWITQSYSLSLQPQNVSVLNTQAQSFDLIDKMKLEISLIERVNVSPGRHVSDSISFNEAGAQWLLK